MNVYREVCGLVSRQVAIRTGLSVAVLVLFSGCLHPEVPLRYRRAIESWGFSTVVSEWGVLTGTSDEGERVEVRMEDPNGLASACHFEAYGHVTDSWCADLDADGKPEVIVTTESYGTGVYGEVWVVKWSHKGLIKVKMPDLDNILGKGYRGHDEFRRGGERRIIRTYPIYLDNDANCRANGGTRLVVYAFRGNQLVVADTQDIHASRTETGTATSVATMKCQK